MEIVSICFVISQMEQQRLTAAACWVTKTIDSGNASSEIALTTYYDHTLRSLEALL